MPFKPLRNDPEGGLRSCPSRSLVVTTFNDEKAGLLISLTRALLRLYKFEPDVTWLAPGTRIETPTGYRNTSFEIILTNHKK
mmetsp:Transcript_13828/g.38905  ORF Transcript_13828/g.38905 Transcript_13828/m.38905 type:complete len:82 (-) Transcript_13828:8-253(-)